MIKIEDFKNAPVGATATNALGSRAMKMNDGMRGWITPKDSYLSDKGMMIFGYVLDPSPATAAREALDHAWVLAHEVKPGQVVPKGTRYLESHGDGLKIYTAQRDFTSRSPGLASMVRTLERLPEPEPGWLNAPAVLAPCGCRGTELWYPRNEKDGTWECTHCGFDCHWSYLRGVTPLYPEETQA